MNPLDVTYGLADLVEPALLEELCQGFVAQHHVGVRVFDLVRQLADGQPLDALAPLLFAHPEIRRRLVAFVDELKGTRLTVQQCVIKEDPVVGARYLLLPIVWEHTVLGKVVCGPYLLTDALPALAEQAVANALAGLPRTTDEVMQAHGAFLVRTLDVVCHSGYRAFLTSNMHLESITEAYEDLKRAHNELAENHTRLKVQNEKLRELDVLKSGFLSTVSHELRTPLTSIIGYTEMLAEELAGPINEEQREYLRTILERALSLLALIEGVLAFSRTDHGARPTTPVSAVAPAAVVAEAVTAVRPQAMKGRLQLELDVKPNLPTLNTDGPGLLQALINLLGNAVKFTDPGGVVRINAFASARGGVPVVRFSVTDTGIGIPPDALDRIFEPFYQVDGSSTRAYGGTGLGLSIVKSFVEGQGGTLDVESALGVGTTFSFDLWVGGRNGGGHRS